MVKRRALNEALQSVKRCAESAAKFETLARAARAHFELEAKEMEDMLAAWGRTNDANLQDA